MTLIGVMVFLVLTLGVTASLVIPLWRPRKASREQEQRDITVYRAQLAEVDSDIERGLITKAQAEAIRAEIHRRMLVADAQAVNRKPLSRRALRTCAVLIAVVVPVSAIALYLFLGAPELPGRPFAERADDAAAWSALGEEISLANEGEVTPEALEDFHQALKRDPMDAQARFYAGLAEAQAGNFKHAVAIWKDLQQSTPPDAPWAALLKDRIKTFAKKGRFDPASVKPSAAWKK